MLGTCWNDISRFCHLLNPNVASIQSWFAKAKIKDPQMEMLMGSHRPSTTTCLDGLASVLCKDYFQAVNAILIVFRCFKLVELTTFDNKAKLK